MNEITLKKLVDEGLSTYKIAQKLNCGQTTVRYWLRKLKLTNKINLTCCICLTDLTGKRTKFCSAVCKTKFHNTKNYSYKAQTERGRKRKIILVELKGGCCKSCGYTKNYAALQFHHTDPTKKEHGLDLRKLSNSTFKWCLDEVEKCELLCANCHTETHYPHFNKD